MAEQGAGYRGHRISGSGRGDFPYEDSAPSSNEPSETTKVMDSYDEGYREGRGSSSGGSSRIDVRPKGGTKTIVAMMAFGTAFSVVGAEIRAAKTPAVTTKVEKALADPFLIIFGGTTAAALLALLAQAGEAGSTFATGLAGLYLVTVLFVNGGPVWNALSSALGGKPTKPLTTTSTTTTTGASK